MIGWDFGGINPNEMLDSDLIFRTHMLIIANGLQNAPISHHPLSPTVRVGIAPHPPANTDPLHTTHGESIAVFRIMHTYA